MNTNKCFLGINVFKSVNLTHTHTNTLTHMCTHTQTHMHTHILLASVNSFLFTSYFLSLMTHNKKYIWSLLQINLFFRERERQTDRQTDRQTETSQKDSKTFSATDVSFTQRQTDRQTDRQTETESKRRVKKKERQRRDKILSDRFLYQANLQGCFLAKERQKEKETIQGHL